jgi:DNA-binding CsgD family transcriptional regulator
LLVAAGARDRARQLWHRADRLAAATEGARTPLLDLRRGGAELTPREREVAQMAAAGASSSIIAQRLELSRRTVENHLQRSYEKLGLHGRDELAEVLLPDRGV